MEMSLFGLPPYPPAHYNPRYDVHFSLRMAQYYVLAKVLSSTASRQTHDRFPIAMKSFGSMSLIWLITVGSRFQSLGKKRAEMLSYSTLVQ